MDQTKVVTTQQAGGARKGEPFLEIRQITKLFDGHPAVDDVSLTINRGEIFALLGASGCGKSTLLRMLAGFERPSSGHILLDGVDIVDVQPYDRPINMMFQSYALFPHMTVYDNVAFGLHQDKMPKDEIAARVSRMLELVHMGEYAKRKPHQLSGGQRQRVALARSLAKRPKLLLLDEPMGALDKKLREEMQLELVNIIEQVGVTCVMVTHDQEEAMTMAGRIAIMNKGRLVQVGEPLDIYEYPNCRYSAGFIGSVNLFEGQVQSLDGSQMRVRTTDLGEVLAPSAPGLSVGQTIWLAMRPERAWMTRDVPPDGVNTVPGVVQDMGYVGHMSSYMVKLETGRLVRVTQANEGRRDNPISWDENVHVSFEPADFRVLTE